MNLNYFNGIATRLNRFQSVDKLLLMNLINSESILAM